MVLLLLDLVWVFLVLVTFLLVFEELLALVGLVFEVI